MAFQNNQRPAAITERQTTAEPYVRLIPFAVICIFLLLAPIIPDVKLSRPKLLLTETSLYGAFFLWIAASIYFGKIKFRKSLLNLPVIVYAASVAVFYFFSPDKPVALSELKRSLLSLVAFFAVSNIVDSVKKRNIALCFLLAGSSLAVIYGILQRWGGVWIIQVPRFDRVISTFGNPIFFAAHIVTVLPVALGAFFYVGKPRVKFLLFCYVSAAVIALYYTQTRAAYLGLGLSLLVLLGISAGQKLKKIVVASVIIVLLAAFGFASRGIWSRQQAHTLIWRDTLTMWASKPFFGTGPGTFHIYFPQFASVELKKIWPQEQNIINDAHSEFIQYLSEMGIVGFGIFLWMLISLFRNALSVKRGLAEQGEVYLVSGFIAGCAGILAQNMFSVDMRFIISSVYLFALAGFVDTFNEDFHSTQNIPKMARLAALILCAAAAFSTFQKVLEPYLAEKKVASTPDFFDEKILEPVKTIQDLEALSRKYPGQALIYEKLGWIYSKEKNWPRAIENFVRSSELNPGSSGPLNNLGNIYFLLGDKANAIRFWNRSIEINPAQVDSRLNLALAYYYSGKLKEASDQIREVLRIDPHNDKAIVMLKQMKE